MITGYPEILVGASIGASVGSAAGAAADRWASGSTLVRPVRSACDACGIRLVWHELVPIVSWLVRRGRCRACDAPIPVLLLLLEIGGAGIGALIAAVHGLSGHRGLGVLVSVMAAGLIFATATDLTARRIPHRLTIPLGAFVLPAAVLVGGDGGGRPVLIWALGLPGLLLVVNAVLRPFLNVDAVGGGDVRLLVSVLAVLALLPAAMGVFLSTLVMTSGGVAAIGLLAGRLTPGDRMPLAPFMLVAFLVASTGSVR